MKNCKVIKNDSEYETEDTNSYSTQSVTHSDASQKQIQVGNGNGNVSNVSNVRNANKYDSIINSDYKNPKGGSKQSLLSKTEIKEKLAGYKTLHKDDYRYLLTLPPFKTWIKYYNPTTKQFRVGGLLMKVDPELRFLTLANTGLKKSWSVQLKNHENIIFVPDPKSNVNVPTTVANTVNVTTNVTKDIETRQLIEENEIKRKEFMVKEKLYKMYLEGKLKKNTEGKDREEEQDPEKIKECATKEKLYKLYKNGKLKKLL